MSYHQNTKETAPSFANLTSSDVCFECGKVIPSAFVQYDGHSDAKTFKSIHLHPACAAIMGQRLIADGYPNRRRGLPES